MFGQVWIWAGHYRGLETNIGVDPRQISAEIRTLVDDAKAWVENNTYELDELAARFHHRLVLIHPFKNGNGRHARVAGDYLIRAIGGEPFSWGAGLRVSTEELRSRYLQALRRADRDRNDIGSLVAFVRS